MNLKLTILDGLRFIEPGIQDERRQNAICASEGICTMENVSRTIGRPGGGAGLRNLRWADFVKKNLAIVFVAQSMTTNNDQILLLKDQ